MYFYHYYNNDNDFQDDYWGTPYHEPWVSRTELGEGRNRANYNKKMTGTYLTIEATGSGNILWKVGSASNAKIIYYKKNDGPWTSITSTTAGASISVVAGDKVMFKGNNATYGTPDWPFDGGSSFMGTTCTFNVYGNIMSLINSENFDSLKSFPTGSTSTFAYLFSGCKVQNASGLCLPATELVENSYGYMFQNCTSLTTPPELPATKLAPNAYYYMFDGCSRLNTFQAVLPATHIEPYCYEGMFRGCSSLRTPPEINGRNMAKFCYKLMFSNSGIRTAPSILHSEVVCGNSCESMFEGCGYLQNAPELPAMEIHGSGYYHMFLNCSSLKNAPELPATAFTLGQEEEGESNGSYQYHQMFMGCTSLEAAPEILPCMKLSINCYIRMFQGCTSLTTAPILPALDPGKYEYCYGNMFNGCSSLNYIKCLATNLGNTNVTFQNWVQGVSDTGMFVKNASATSWPTGNYGIPSGWMIINDGESYVFVDKNSAVPNSTIKVTSNTEWTATTSDSWISLSTTAGTSGETTITVTCTGSPSGTHREGTITIGQNTIVVNQANLPAGYTQVSYISSTYGGHQYINLGLLMCSASPISFQIEGKAKVKSADSQGVLIGCMREASPYPGFLIRRNSSTSSLQYVKCNGDTQENFGTIGSVLNINITQNSYTTDRIHDVPATLFCGLNGSGNPFRYTEAEIYSLHITTYGTELYLVPCLNSNDVPGLYDTIGGTFYDSDGSNPFTYSN